MRAIISGLGAWLPPSVITNAEISSRLNTTPEWIETRTGIHERRMVTDGMSTLDLAIQAGMKALKSAPQVQIDLVIVATSSPDRLCLAVAPEVASSLGLGVVAAYDINLRLQRIYIWSGDSQWIYYLRCRTRRPADRL